MKDIIILNLRHIHNYTGVIKNLFDIHFLINYTIKAHYFLTVFNF